MNEVEFITAVRHLSWVSYQIAAGQSYNEAMNDDQEEALRDGVINQLENPDVTTEESHRNWVSMKRAQGWVYGPVKDFDKKTHPNLVDFVDLPDIEKLKDLASTTAHRMALDLWDEFNTDG